MHVIDLNALEAALSCLGAVSRETSVTTRSLANIMSSKPIEAEAIRRRLNAHNQGMLNAYFIRFGRDKMWRLP